MATSSISTVWDILPDQLSRPSFTEKSIEQDDFWCEYERRGVGSDIHIAILAKKYVELILNKDKTIESRFSMHRRMPYQRISQGDVILFKESGGPIRGIAYVATVNFFKFPEDLTLETIKELYGEELQIQDDEYWDRYSKSSYGTLITLEHVRRIEPMQFSKRDRNAWVIFSNSTE